MMISNHSGIFNNLWSWAVYEQKGNVDLGLHWDTSIDLYSHVLFAASLPCLVLVLWKHKYVKIAQKIKLYSEWVFLNFGQPFYKNCDGLCE